MLRAQEHKQGSATSKESLSIGPFPRLALLLTRAAGQAPPPVGRRSRVHEEKRHKPVHVFRERILRLRHHPEHGSESTRVAIYHPTGGQRRFKLEGSSKDTSGISRHGFRKGGHERQLSCSAPFNSAHLPYSTMSSFLPSCVSPPGYPF